MTLPTMSLLLRCCCSPLSWPSTRQAALAFGQHANVQSEARDRVGLTAREGDILDLLAGGLTATAIAHVCRISPATVRKHLQNIYAKIGCSDRLLAVERARRLGLLPRVSRLKSA